MIENMYKMQREFDERVVKAKGLESEYLLLKKRVALRVELGEMVNELPELFKYWSSKKNNWVRALEEYVDGLHFVLSIGLEIDCDIAETVEAFSGKKFKRKNPLLVLESIYNSINFIGIDDYYSSFVINYLELGYCLGFTWEQIFGAYKSKNLVNHVRQDNGY